MRLSDSTFRVSHRSSPSVNPVSSVVKSSCMPILRKIIAFHQADQSHWVAVFECGHSQHVRHDPPWSLRPWVLTPDGRASHRGRELPCKKCESNEPEK